SKRPSLLACVSVWVPPKAATTPCSPPTLRLCAGRGATSPRGDISMSVQVAAAHSRVREYESIYVMRPDVAREGAERVSQRVQEVMTREGAKLSLVETWGRRSLAYKVNKHRHGIYVYLR